jgi:ATP/maltotriose-dependent transcriptional regulator MalT
MTARAGNVFVGRARELAELERAMDDARAGRGAAMLVAGDAGIGKSRLVSELVGRAQATGFVVFLGHSIDLAGTDLPFHPFVEALRPLGQRWDDGGQVAGSQLRVFEKTLAVLGDRAALDPVLLVLEDVHWADVSTLDLVLFLAHHVAVRPILLVVTARLDEIGPGDRMRILADGIRRSGVGRRVDLSGLEDGEISALLEAAITTPLPPVVVQAIVDRSEGNPFFAEELLAVAGDGDGGLPHSLREMLLHRTTGLDRATLHLLGVVAAAGGEIAYPVLSAAFEGPETEARECLRRTVQRGIVVVARDSDRVRFRHALLAEAVYGTLLPGEREDLHARLAMLLVDRPDSSPAELARHWAAARRSSEALHAWIEAATQSERMAGLAEAHRHLERAIALWDRVPAAAELTGIDLADLCARSARLAGHAGAAPRAVELVRRAIDLTRPDRLLRLADLHVLLGEYLFQLGDNDAGLAALRDAVDLAPTQPPSPERAYALGSLAGGLMVAWQFAESLPLAREALAISQEVGAGPAEVRARTVIGVDLPQHGHPSEGLAELRHALRLAEEIEDLVGLDRAYVNLTDTLLKLGRVRESAREAAAGIAVTRRHGITSQLLTANYLEALLAAGDWDEAERVSTTALRTLAASFPYMIHMHRADLDTGRGDFESARRHLDAASATIRPHHLQGTYEAQVAEVALWEQRWTAADQALHEALARVTSPATAQLRVWFIAKRLRAQADLAALARAHRDAEAVRDSTVRAKALLTDVRRAATIASAVTPNADAWLAQADAEYARVCGDRTPEPWVAAATAWDRLERPPNAAYCRWRETEARLASGATRAEASESLRSAHAAATNMAAVPLLRELEALALRARLELRTPEQTTGKDPGLGELLGLTPREAEVLQLIAQGCTNREIAQTLVISEKTTGVHVSHILHKLGVPSRLEAGAIAHRLTPPPPYSRVRPLTEP